jgi:hypothetical protein
VEVDADRPRAEPVTPGSPDAPRDRTRVRLNLALYAVAVICVATIGLLGSRIWGTVEDTDGFWDHVGDVVRDPSDADTSRAGDRIGDARVQALPIASRDEQERTAAVIEAANTMVTTFLNVDYQEVDAAQEAVRPLLTGPFRKQYDKSTEDLAKLYTRAKQVQTGEVLWAGVVAADDDSATVLVATTGTIKSKATKQKEVDNNYRLQLELTLEDGQWLTRDLQFVN